jgi:AAA+ ATPase superfamily predicted ATPase
MSIKSGTNKFVGRDDEVGYLKQVQTQRRAALVVIHGRRRVGKTTLIERVYQDRNILKIEGVEGGSRAQQIETALMMLATHVKDPTIAKLKFSRWLEVFELIARYVKHGVQTLYLEELQWLAHYEEELISDFKHVWDNHFSKNPELTTVLCGSSPSFMVNKVLHSNALYGRSQHEVCVRPFTLNECRVYLGSKHPIGTVMDVYLSIGGIPEYLSYLTRKSSFYLSLCDESFKPEGYFFRECERVFISSLTKNKNYRKIIEFLAKRKFSTRMELANELGIPQGGSLSSLLSDLEMSGFIQAYSPYDRDLTTKLARYEISDAYLQFYYRFVKPKQRKILQGAFNDSPSRALNLTEYQQWLGYSFERWCRSNHTIIAKILGFSAVHYDAGPYYSRKTPEHFQLDLVFSRADKVITVCEIKYKKTPVTRAILAEFERKLDLFPTPASHSIQKVLIAANGCDESVRNAGYFDEIVDLDLILKYSERF